jgi:23S rRNA (pseudouridine1915-N3)-methyltransferase
MRELLILWAGRRRYAPWEALCGDYRGRISRFTALEDRQIKVRAGGGEAARRRAEGQALVTALPEPCWTIALDARGRTLSSEGLAAEIQRLTDEWPHPVAFLIGSELGLDPEVASGARRRLSFGPMILGHQLARLVLYEQLYRAISINRGIKYHRPAF